MFYTMAGALTMTDKEKRKQQYRCCWVKAKGKAKSFLGRSAARLKRPTIGIIWLLCFLYAAYFGPSFASLEYIEGFTLILAIFGTVIGAGAAYSCYLRPFCLRRGFDTNRALKNLGELTLIALGIFGPLFIGVLIIAHNYYPDALKTFNGSFYALLIIYPAMLGSALDAIVTLNIMEKRWKNRKNNILGTVEGTIIEGTGYLFWKADWCH